MPNHSKVFSTFVALSVLLGSSLASIGPVANLEIVNKVIQPDGLSRSTVLAGGVFPAPLIAANRGDAFQINVTDSLTDSSMERATSIHWHGLFQNGTNFNDGVASVTQCPIIPGHSFTYAFSPSGQAGTFWYHSHLSTQYCDGLRGPLVIYDPNDPHANLYDIDNESTVITLSDWYHLPSTSALYGPAPFPFPDSTLINGLGRFKGGPLSPLAVVGISPGKRYRLRIVAMACHPQWVFTIDGHKFTVIEADGISTQPLEVDSFLILAGQRYSVVLKADQPVDNYWIRAQPNLGDPTFLGGINSAILRYEGAKDVEPISTQSASTKPLVETDLHALENPGAPGKPEVGGADVNINLEIGFNLLPIPNYTVNGVSFESPSVPVLLQILSGAQDATSLLPKGSVYTLPPNKVIEISFSGEALGGPHPFHLHGHAFDVIRSAGNETYNFVNPVRRDVVNVGGTTGKDRTTIRFVTDNAGPWFLHCHIDWHLNMGLAIVFAEDTGHTAEHSPVTAEWRDLCPAYNAFVAH